MMRSTIPSLIAPAILLTPASAAIADSGGGAWPIPSAIGSLLLVVPGVLALAAIRKRPAPARGSDRRGTEGAAPAPAQPAAIRVTEPGDLTLGAELRAYVETLAADPALGVGLARAEADTRVTRAAS